MGSFSGFTIPHFEGVRMASPAWTRAPANRRKIVLRYLQGRLRAPRSALVAGVMTVVERAGRCRCFGAGRPSWLHRI
jgi:hypothetical protein